MKRFIMANNYEQVKLYCDRSKSEAIYLTRVEQLRGLKEIDILILPGADMHKEYSNIMQEASLRNSYISKLDESLYLKLMSITIN